MAKRAATDIGKRGKIHRFNVVFQFGEKIDLRKWPNNRASSYGFVHHVGADPKKQ